MTTTKHDKGVSDTRLERPQPSDIKQLFERYRRVSRRLYDAERPSATWAKRPSPPERRPGGSRAR